MDATTFYKSRGDRTDSFIDSARLLNQKICVSVGQDAIDCRAGQQLLLNLTNQLSRLFNQIEFNLHHDNKLLAWSPIPKPGLSDSILALTSAIDPYGKFSVVCSPSEGSLKIGIGETVEKCKFYLGCDRWIAELSKTAPLVTTDFENSLFGAALSSCIGAAAATLHVTGQPFSNRKISAWNFLENDNALNGPDWECSLDLGKTLVVGAGAVGSCLAYWARTVGINPDWTVVDKDKVKLHNTNRGLLFFPYHTAEFRREGGVGKCDAILEFLPDIKVENNWYHDSTVAKDMSFDLVIPVANEFEIRELVSKRYMPIVMHATTGRNWLSQFHRHVIGTDDCIVCRLGEIEKKINFNCSEATLRIDSPHEEGKIHKDTALPFLSGGSGILLLTGLVKLANYKICDSKSNDIRLDFKSNHRMSSVGTRRCSDMCATTSMIGLTKSIYKSNKWIAYV